jgi:hypothetical protein
VIAKNNNVKNAKEIAACSCLFVFQDKSWGFYEMD